MPDIPAQVSTGGNIPTTWFNGMRDLVNNLFGSVSGAGRLIYSNGLRSVTSLAPPTTDSYLKYDHDNSSIAWQDIGTALGSRLYIDDSRDSNRQIIPAGSQVLILTSKFAKLNPTAITNTFSPTPGSVFTSAFSGQININYDLYYSNGRNVYRRSRVDGQGGFGTGSGDTLVAGNPYLPTASTTSFAVIRISGHRFYLSITSAGVLYVKGENTNVFNNVTLTYPSSSSSNSRIYVSHRYDTHFYVVRKPSDNVNHEGGTIQLYRFPNGTSSSPFTSVNFPTVPDVGPITLEGPYNYESGVQWTSFTGCIHRSVLWLPFLTWKEFDNSYQRNFYIRGYSLVDGSIVTDFRARLPSTYPRGYQNFPTTVGLAAVRDGYFNLFSNSRYNINVISDFRTAEGIMIGYLNEGEVFLSNGRRVVKQNNLVV